jgi:hypothetical protein
MIERTKEQILNEALHRELETKDRLILEILIDIRDNIGGLSLNMNQSGEKLEDINSTISDIPTAINMTNNL